MRLPRLRRVGLQPRLSPPSLPQRRDPRQHAADGAQPALLCRSDGGHAGGDRNRFARRLRRRFREFAMSLTQLGHPSKLPEATILESKSLKLYLGAFRNHAAFHEDCTLSIARRLVETLAPQWLRIGGYWYPRGGIPIDVFYQTAEPPAGLWLPDPGVAAYRGRG